MNRLKQMLTPQQFYTWCWVLEQKQKAEAGDKKAFQLTDAEQIAAFRQRKGMTD